MNLNEYQTTPLITHKITQIHPFQLISSSSNISGSKREPFIDRANIDNKKMVQVKQYSNKFLRESMVRQQSCNTKINLKHRLNLIMKKKQFLNRTNFKQNPIKIQEIPQQQKPQQQSFMKVNKILKSHHQRTKRIATENPQHNHQRSSIINQLQHQIILNSSPFNNHLNSNHVSNLHVLPVNIFNTNQKFKYCLPKETKEREQSLKKNNFILSNEQQFRQKISQSRGLELYSKIFIRNRSQMIQKMKIQKSKSRKKQMMSKINQVEQNFETRKITPIEKIKRIKNISISGCDKFFSKKNTHCMTDNNEYFQINPWETTL